MSESNFMSKLSIIPRTLLKAMLQGRQIPEHIGNLGTLNHIAIAKKSIPLPGKKQAVPAHGVSIRFSNILGLPTEWMEPLGDKSPIQNYVNKASNEVVHHVCIEVDDLDAAIAFCKGKNIRTLTQKPSAGAHGSMVIFLHPKDCGGVLIELEQRNKH